jgi:uncharacterized protein
MLPARKHPHRLIVALRAVLAVALAAVAVPAWPIGPAAAEAADLGTREVTFTGHGGLTMHGTVIAPVTDSVRRPGLLLIGGSDWRSRTQLLPEARAFAHLGLVTLIYDKRSSSKTRLDYSLLADDAQAAFGTLRRQPGVDPSRVGVWGRSEGAWVAPLVASRAPDVAFVVTVGAVGMAPARQTAWFWTNLLRHSGVSGSLLRAFPLTFTRFAVDAGLFAEADYDPVPVLEHLHQPILMLWSADDFVHPPQESSQVMRRALDQGGNTHYTIRFLPRTGPDLHRTTNGGWDRLPDVAPGYPEQLVSWIGGLADSPPPATTQAPPHQDRQTVPLASPAWYESATATVAALVLMLIAFASHPLTATINRLRRNDTRATTPAARWLAGTGLATIFGLLCYFPALLISGGALLDPVILGRPILWLLLQLLAAATVMTGIATAIAMWRDRHQSGPTRRIQLGLLLTGTVVFIPWAICWGLLLL